MKTKVVKRPGKAYPLEVRRQVVMEYFTGNLSNKDLALKYKLADPSLISHWVRTFRPEYLQQRSAAMPSKKKKVLTDNEISLEKELHHLRQELSRKEKELEYERLKAAAYRMMIETTEKDLDISILKKAGSKQ